MPVNTDSSPLSKAGHPWPRIGDHSSRHDPKKPLARMVGEQLVAADIVRQHLERFVPALLAHLGMLAPRAASVKNPALNECRAT